MKYAPIPANDRERLDALLSYKILDTTPEQEFDDITRLAAEICNTPISVITLMDENRQWFKSKVGLDETQTDRETSFCSHAISTPDKNFIVENAREDVRFYDNPLVTNGTVGSYVGIPLVNPQGFALGALCVIDPEPKRLEDFQIKALEKLANQVTKLLELHKINYKLVESHNQLVARYEELEKFSSMVSHDLKSPLNNIMMFSKLLGAEYGDKLDDKGRDMLGYIGASADQLRKLIDGILEHYKNDAIDLGQREKIRLREVSKYIIDLLQPKDDFEFILPDAKVKFKSNSIAIGQILYNLIANGIKYNDKEKGIITIAYEEDSHHQIISVSDNGTGIPEAHFEEVFEIFKTLDKMDRFHAKGTGIGLSTVKKLVDKLNGRIELESKPGIGSTFRIYLKK